MSFDGLRVLSLESRRAKEMETMIVRLGGDALVAPSVQERALDDRGKALQFVERLEADEFDLLICMTGAGLAFLRDLAAAHMPLERLSAALRRAAIISRGPKPLPVLRALDVPVAVVVPEPNTWRQIVTAVAARPERRIAVQEYGRPNTEMDAALKDLGAKVTPIAIYRWEMPSDLEPLRMAARRLAAGEIDAALFTSSIQLDHLLEIAREMNLEARVLEALRREVAVASVGPVMTAALEANGIAVDIVPNHPKMGALVKAAAELAPGVRSAKRSVLKDG
jgi:uroporphyrinogen-III synthase